MDARQPSKSAPAAIADCSNTDTMKLKLEPDMDKLTDNNNETQVAQEAGHGHLAAGDSFFNVGLRERPHTLSGDGKGELEYLSQSLDREMFRRRGTSVAEVREQATSRVMEELRKAQEELALKDEECEKLSRVRKEIETELEDLTASLFEQAHAMVREANIQRANAEKLLLEANGKIEVLTAEVAALKTLVLTSTPSSPNRHMHPQLTSDQVTAVKKGHKRSPSHNDIKRSNSLRAIADSKPQHDTITTPATADADGAQSGSGSAVTAHHACGTVAEVDPAFYEAFVTWRDNASLNQNNVFIKHIFEEDIKPTMNFANSKLAEKVLRSIEQNMLTIEPIHGNNTFPRPTDDTIFMRKCQLTDGVRVCKYRMQLVDDDQLTWYYISKFSRDRIATVCDFFTYIRYITQGLVKTQPSQTYQEVIRLRKCMSLAKLGLLNAP